MIRISYLSFKILAAASFVEKELRSQNRFFSILLPCFASFFRKFIMGTKDDEIAEQPIKDKSTGGGPKTCLLLTGLLLALGLGAAGVTIGSLALNKANDNEDIFTDLDFSSATDDESTANEDDTSVFLGGSPTLQAIYDRGVLKCAVVLSPGFAGENDTGELYGFDIDICRAIANGVLGDPGAVDFQIVTFADRFQVLADNVADVTSITTHTMERDVYQDGAQQGFTFSTTYFYEGLGYAGSPSFVECVDNIDWSGACADLKLCVADGSTWIDILRVLFPEVNLVPTISSEDGFPKLEDGSCNVVAGERHDLGGDYAIANGYTGAYVLGNNILSKEPLAFVTRDNDARWSDVVNWVIQALLSADELGTTQSTAQDMGTFDLLGEEFENLFIRAVEASGNYGEIYARNMESIVPRGGLNRIRSGDSGRHYSYPFGSLDTVGSTPDGKLREIMDRGELRCGVNSVAGFSTYNYDEWRWVGFDVDYCRALSAAIFSGDPTRVLLVKLTSSQRFNALASGEVDVLSRTTTHTLARDILEPTSQVGFTFSAPTYYDGLTYGGVAGYVTCAENIDAESAECTDLLICVKGFTTYSDVLSKLFSADNVRVFETDASTANGLVSGECNVIATGSVEIVAVNELGGYTISGKRVSKDPLALVTRQDDAQWADFVYWIVGATFYAEENGIARATASEMPSTNLFGPLLQDMLKDAIRGVGSYGEIYEDNLEAFIARSGLNELNKGGALFYPLPGF